MTWERGVGVRESERTLVSWRTLSLPAVGCTLAIPRPFHGPPRPPTMSHGPFLAWPLDRQHDL